MSGHNKWSKVKHIKGPLDAKRGKLFTKLIKEITIASRTGGSNPDGNARLRTAIAAAKSSSMPKENIERAVKRGAGESVDGMVIEEVLYEGYGPGGVAIVVETTTDNRNRTVNDLRVLFRKGGGNLGEGGSVSWMFNHYGQLLFDATKVPEDKVMEVALEAGAQDIVSAEGTIEVLTDPSEIYRIKDAFERVGIHPTQVGFSYVPKTSVPVEKSTAEKLLPLLSEVEDHDDVQRVHANFEIDDRILSELAQSAPLK